MGLLDAYQDSTDRSLTVMAARPIDPEPPKPKHSGWSTIPRAVAGAFTETAGNIMDVASAYGQVQAATGANANPLIPDSPEDRKQRLEAFDKLKTEGIDWQPEESRPHYQMARDLRPDPLTAGAAENIVFGLTKGLTKAIGAGMIAGPVAGATSFGVSEGMTTAEDLAAQGVDPATRMKVGAVTGALNTAGMALPVAGTTLLKTAGLVAAGGPASFIAQQLATRQILESADYGRLAQQYDPLDPTGLAIATLLPAGFGAWAMRGAFKAKPAEVKTVLESGAPAEPVKPVATQEQVDAAMVHNLTLARDAHEATTPDPIRKMVEQAKADSSVPRADNLSPEHRVVETRMRDLVTGDTEAAIAKYATLKDSEGGKVINTDIARELSPDYSASKEARSSLSAAVHEPASWLTKVMYARKLAEPDPNGLNLVTFTAGGAGAGKSSAIDGVGAAKAMKDLSQIVYDTNMNNLESSITKVDQALAAGKKVNIVFIGRDPVEALVNGSLTRAMNKGRTVSLFEHAKTHTGSAAAIPEMMAHYAGNERVNFHFIDNTKGKGKQAAAGPELLSSLKFDNLEARLKEALDHEYQAGRISEAVYRGTQGHDAQATGRISGESDGAGASGKYEGSAGPTGQAQAGGLKAPSDAPGSPAGKAQPSDGSPTSADPHIASILSRAEALKAQQPDMPVAVREDGSLATFSEELAAIRRQAQEGTDDAFGAQDAPLIQVAVECLLSMGAGSA